MKTCKICKEEKPLTEFYVNLAMRDGVQNSCKKCHREAMTNRVKEKSKDPEWFERELDRQREKARKYRNDGRAKPVVGERARQRSAAYAAKHRHKVAAHKILGNAVRDGKIQRQPCSVCGSQDSEAHHDDYSKPLDVIWFCPAHHAARHVELRRQQRLAAIA